jgi:ketosteroid isomerase-like protein
MRSAPAVTLTLQLLACASAPAGGNSALQAALDADRAMSEACVGRDREAFLRHVAPDALFVGSQLSAGREAVGASWGPLLSPGGPELSWTPLSGEAAPAGDLVLTLGAWRLAPGGQGKVSTGRYATVWRRDGDGVMRAVLDGDATALPPLRPSVRREPARTVASADAYVVADGGRLVDGGRTVGRYLRVRIRSAHNGLRTAVDAGSLDAD